MKNEWKSYWSSFRIRALLETQYRAAAFGGVVTQAFFGLVLICLYEALYAGQSYEAFRETVTYVWLQQMLFRALFVGDGELLQQIMTGGVAYSMIRPVDQHAWWSSRILALKTVGSLMRLTPMLLLQLILPERYRALPPASPLAFAQFLLGLVLGLWCLTQVSAISAAIVMRTLDNRGVSSILNLLMALMAGNVIPLTLFPDRLQAWVRYQPFAQALDMPIRMYLQQQTLAEWMLNAGVQLAWVIAMTLLARSMWKRQLGRMIVQGG